MKKFSKKNLIIPILPTLLLSWIFEIITAMSVLALVMSSGQILGQALFAITAVTALTLVHYFAMGRTLGRYVDLMISHQAIFTLLQQLRTRFFVEYTKLSPIKRRAISSSDAQYRLVRDIDSLSQFVLRVLAPYVVGIVALVFGCVLCFWLLGVQAFWIVMVCVLMVLVVAINALGTHWVAEQEEAQKQRQSDLLTALPMLPQLVLWGRWQDICGRIIQADSALAKIYYAKQQKKRQTLLIMQLLLASVVVLVLIFGVNQINNIGLPWLLSLVLMSFGLFELVITSVKEPDAYKKTTLAITRLNELTAESTSNKIPLPDKFQWHAVGLSAKQEGAVFGIKNIDFCVYQGTPLVICGVSGGGKSTLLDVLAGELATTSGQLFLVDNDNSSDTKLDIGQIDFGGQLGYLGQRIDIFDQSLRDNLLLGNANATDEMLWQVLSEVGLEAWAKNSPRALDTPLGEYGTAVSGGQARRIALARLLLNPKKILLLDEPFAGVDAPTRKRIWHNLQARQKDGMLIVVSHHADIIQSADRVLHIGEPSMVD